MISIPFLVTIVCSTAQMGQCQIIQDPSSHSSHEPVRPAKGAGVAQLDFDG